MSTVTQEMKDLMAAQRARRAKPLTEAGTTDPEVMKLRAKVVSVCEQAAKDAAMAAEYAEKAENAMRGIANTYFMSHFHAGHAAPIQKLAAELDRETESIRTTARQIKFGEYDRGLEAFLRHPQVGG